MNPSNMCKRLLFGKRNAYGSGTSLWIIFSRVLVQQTAWEVRNNVSLWRRRLICLLSNLLVKSSQGKAWAWFLTAPYDERSRYPRLGVPPLWHKLPWCEHPFKPNGTWGGMMRTWSLCYLLGFEWVFCLRPRSLMSPVSIYYVLNSVPPSPPDSPAEALTHRYDYI